MQISRSRSIRVDYTLAQRVWVEMTIALLLEGLAGGGVERATLRLAAGMAAAGHDVDLLIAGPDGPLRAETSPLVGVVQLAPTAPLAGRWMAFRAQLAGNPMLATRQLLSRRRNRILHYLPDLAAYLQRCPPQVLVSAGFHANLVAIWARRQARVAARVIVTEHLPPSQHFCASRKRRHRAVPSLMRRFYPRADAIVAVSSALAEDLSRFAGLPADRIHTIYNAVVNEELAARAAEDVDHPWLKPGQPPVILGVGRLTRQKDFVTLLHAFARMRCCCDARLIILGDPQTHRHGAAAELAACAETLGVAEYVSLPGYKPNSLAYMSRAAAFVLSSRFEGLPTVLIEAMACGCPVVSTDCPTGPKEILENGRFGPLVPTGDPSALADAIMQALRHPLPAAALRARADEFNTSSAVEKYLDLAGNPRPSESVLVPHFKAAFEPAR